MTPQGLLLACWCCDCGKWMEVVGLAWEGQCSRSCLPGRAILPSWPSCRVSPRGNSIHRVSELWGDLEDLDRDDGTTFHLCQKWAECQTWPSRSSAKRAVSWSTPNRISNAWGRLGPSSWPWQDLGNWVIRGPQPSGITAMIDVATSIGAGQPWQRYQTHVSSLKGLRRLSVKGHNSLSTIPYIQGVDLQQAHKCSHCRQTVFALWYLMSCVEISPSQSLAPTACLIPMDVEPQVSMSFLLVSLFASSICGW